MRVQEAPPSVERTSQRSYASVVVGRREQVPTLAYATPARAGCATTLLAQCRPSSPALAAVHVMPPSAERKRPLPQVAA